MAEFIRKQGISRVLLTFSFILIFFITSLMAFSTMSAYWQSLFGAGGRKPSVYVGQAIFLVFILLLFMAIGKFWSYFAKMRAEDLELEAEMAQAFGPKLSEGQVLQSEVSESQILAQSPAWENSGRINDRALTSYFVPAASVQAPLQSSMQVPVEPRVSPSEIAREAYQESLSLSAAEEAYHLVLEAEYKLQMSQSESMSDSISLSESMHAQRETRTQSESLRWSNYMSEQERLLISASFSQSYRFYSASVSVSETHKMESMALEQQQMETSRLSVKPEASSDFDSIIKRIENLLENNKKQEN